MLQGKGGTPESTERREERGGKGGRGEKKGGEGGRDKDKGAVPGKKGATGGKGNKDAAVKKGEGNGWTSQDVPLSPLVQL